MSVTRSTKKNKTNSNYKIVWIRIDEIHVPDDRRKCNVAFVKSLAKDIETDGLRTPISVYKDEDGTYVLVAGLHRLKAFKRLSRKKIPAFVVAEKGAEGWSITENWLRYNDDYLRTCCELARLAKLRIAIPSKGGKQPEDKGISKVAAAFNMNRSTISRMLKVAGLDNTVQMFIREHKLQRRKTLLCEVSALEDRSAQIQMLQPYVANQKRSLTNSSNDEAFNVGKSARKNQEFGSRDGSKSFGSSKSKSKASNDRYEKLRGAWNRSDVAKLYKKEGPDTQAKFVSKIFKRDIIDSALYVLDNK